MRSSTDNAEFSLNNVKVGGRIVTVAKYFPQLDPESSSNALHASLGQYIGQDDHAMKPENFQPWSESSM